MAWQVKLRVEMTISVEQGNQHAANEYAIARLRDALTLMDPKAEVSLAETMPPIEKIRRAKDHARLTLELLEGLL